MAGGLLTGGLLLTGVFTVLHPSGAEENHEFIFAEYAASDAWVAVHLGQFVGVLLGLAFALTGVAMLTGRLVAGWLGWVAMLAGLCSVAIGVDVGYSGLASRAEDVLSLAFLIVALTFAVGLLVSGVRERGRHRSRT